MFFSKLTNGKKTGEDNGERVIFLILIAVLVGALLASVISLDFLKNPPPIFPDTPALTTVESADHIPQISNLPFYQPANTHTAYGMAFGVFTQPYEAFPRGSAIAAYRTDKWLAFRIEQYPNKTINELKNQISFTDEESVNTEEGQAVLLHLKSTGPTCFQPTDEEVGRCPIKLVLLVQKPGMVVALASDGTRTTKGQLIDMGRNLSKIRP